MSVRCSGCGDPAVWAVALPYQHGRRPGRPLAYYDRDREYKAAAILVTIPLDSITDDVFVASIEMGGQSRTRKIASVIIFGMPRHGLGDGGSSICRARARPGPRSFS